jgi:SAM-dependent MidA family methyltransferase
MKLSDIIIQRIRQQGQISFREFMEMALYYPGLGYYTSDKKKIGKTGDYYTSSNLTPAFGEMLGKQIEEMWHILGKEEMRVVEMGAGSGILSGDVLTYLSRNPELFHDLNYCIVEKSPNLRKEQQEHLNHEKVNWFNSISELKGMRGCIFSNELPDAFPVYLVEM